MTVRVQLRRGTAAQWTSADPTLASGEMGLETDTGKFKVGDGVSAWGVLPYSSGPAGPAGPAGPTGTVTAAGDGTEALPGIAFASDLNTGIYRPGADQLALSTNGTGRLFVDANGSIRTGNAVFTGEGATTGECFIKLGEKRSADGPSYLAVYGQSGAGSFNFTRYGGANGVAEITNQGSGNINIATLGAGALLFTTNSTEKLRITSAGLVGIGTSAPDELLHIRGDVAEFKATNTNPIADTGGTEQIFKIGVEGQKNNVYGPAASIIFRQDNTSWSSVDPINKPTRIEFCTQGDPSGDSSETPRLVINRLGNVGIGTASPGGTLDIKAATSTTPLIVQGSSSEFARIDRFGRLLVGTASSSAPTTVVLQGNVSSTTGQAIIYMQRGVSPAAGVLGELRFADSAANEGAKIEATTDGTWIAGSSHPGLLRFSTTPDGSASPVERMRITQNGSIIFDGTGNTTAVTTGSKLHLNSTAAGLILYAAADGDKPVILNRNGSDGVLVDMRRANVSVGGISVTTTNTAYNTSSDYRLKENVTPVTDGITRLQQLKPSRFNFIADPAKTVDGFLAHEVQAIVPEAITGEKDEVDDEGNPQYQGIDQSKLVPLLTAALQEAIAKIETLEQRLNDAGIN